MCKDQVKLISFWFQKENIDGCTENVGRLQGLWLGAALRAQDLISLEFNCVGLTLGASCEKVNESKGESDGSLNGTQTSKLTLTLTRT